MSHHNPHPNYNYCPPAPTYYIDDQERCMADYSDSDCYSDHQQSLPLQTMRVRRPPETYSTHPQMRSLQVVPMKKRFHSSQPYIPQCYYEKAPANLQRTLTALPLKSSVPHYPYPSHQHCPIEESLDNYHGHPAYRNSYPNSRFPYQQNSKGHRNIQQTTLPHGVIANQHLKRYPITVGTPKYYRRPPTNTLYRRPSALCLPVSSQPDPAITRRPRKPTANNRNYDMQMDVNNSIEYAKTDVKKDIIDADLVPHKMHSEGDVTEKLSNFEAMLEKFETETMSTIVKGKNDVARISKFFRPKMPASIKAKQVHPNTKTSHSAMGRSHHESKRADSNWTGDEYKFEIPEVTADSLEKLLDQLKKCEGGENRAARNEVLEERRHENNVDLSRDNGNCVEKSDVTDDEQQPRPLSKSFNYRDITQQMTRTQEELKSQDSSSSIRDITRRLASSVTDSTAHKPRPFAPKPALDDHCALELHRSKSYIVDLIDKALSRELGTVPGERSRRKFDNMNPKKAIDLMNRHVGKSEKDISVEITSALTDSIISNVTAPEDLPTTNSKTKICTCNSEEPVYIKQLKQLRWGHLKHIQREVRRLEDLERFLDSCSITTIPEM